MAALLSLGMVLSSGCGSGGGSVPADGGGTPPPDSGGTASGVLKIFVARDGIYKLTYDALKSSGFNVVGISCNDLKLTTFADGGETEIPLRVSDGDDGRLDSGDFLEFYGTGIPRGDRRFEFTETNVYWLSGEAGSRKRISAKSLPPLVGGVNESFFPVLLHVEEDTHYWENMPDEDPLDGVKPDRWMWGSYLVAGETRDVFIPLIRNHDPGSPVLLKFRFQGRSLASDHQVKVYLNFSGNLISDETWTWGGLVSQEFTVDITNKGFLDGTTNSLRIENGGTNELSQFYLDWFEVSYRDTLKSDDGASLVFQGSGEAGSQTVRQFQLKGFPVTGRPDVYDVTGYPAEVGWISPSTVLPGVYQFQDVSGRRYVAVTDAGKITPSIPPLSVTSCAPPCVVLDDSNDLKGTGGADEIIITHENFHNAVLPLAQFRTGQGLKVVTAKIGDVYDAFSGGVTDPLAIKDFLKYAYQNWNPAPRYVLLVGDASYDYKEHLPYCSTVLTCSYVPTHLYDFGDLGEVPSDNWFADVVQDDGLGLPEMAVGRIPAKTATQATNTVDKILYYETHAPSGNSSFRYLFVADNNDDPSVTDPSRFELLSSHLATNPLYADQIPDTNSRFLFLGETYGNDLVSFRTDLLSALNEGPLLVNYAGHGSAVDWGQEELFRSESYTNLNGEIIPGVSGTSDSMTNQGNYPFVISLDCLNGNFAFPAEGAILDGLKMPRSLAEEFLMAKDKGAVAAWAGSALGYPTDHEALGQRLFEKIFAENQRVLGDAVTGAMADASPEVILPADVFSTFIFFGDPATRLAIP